MFFKHVRLTFMLGLAWEETVRAAQGNPLRLFPKSPLASVVLGVDLVDGLDVAG